MDRAEDTGGTTRQTASTASTAGRAQGGYARASCLTRVRWSVVGSQARDARLCERDARERIVVRSAAEVLTAQPEDPATADTSRSQS